MTWIEALGREIGDIVIGSSINAGSSNVYFDSVKMGEQ